MAEDQVVANFEANMKRLAEVLDRKLNGLRLLMVFQTKVTLDAGTWNLCVCADSLDELTPGDAIDEVIHELESQDKRVPSEGIARIIILKSSDPATHDLLDGIDSPKDSRRLRGRYVYDRRIAAAKLFLVRSLDPKTGELQALTA
jgi:hypothetical protein